MTFLMPEHFEVIAGEAVVERIRSARAGLARPYTGVVDSCSLAVQQEREARAGVRGAELVKSLLGWSVRYDSGLQDFGLIAGVRQRQVDGTYECAVAYARKWVADDPDNRYAWVRRSHAEVERFAAATD